MTKPLVAIAAVAVIALALSTACSTFFGPTPRPYVIELTANTDATTPYDFLVSCNDRSYLNGEDRLGPIGFTTIDRDPEVRSDVEMCWSLMETMEAERQDD